MGRSSEEAALSARIDAVDWRGVVESLDRDGFARIPELLGEEQTRSLADLWRDEGRFRKRVVLAQHRFGDGGEYKYLRYPLPTPVARLRQRLYARLAVVANRWSEQLRRDERWPRSLTRFLADCHAHGQTRPTPLLLRYWSGGYNRMHQDLYGALAFPLQVTVLLSRPGVDFLGGEFLLLENRPRMQSRAEAVALGPGEAIVFPTRERPVAGARGFSRAQLRHGVSRIHEGERTTLGIIFHDAR
jgi:hypothetical protein